MIKEQDFFRTGVKKINRIEELDLKQTTRDIVEFFAGHGSFASYDIVYDFVDKWSILKYDLYVKMGKKLSVSTLVPGNLRLEKSDITKRAEDLAQSKKRTVKDQEIFRISELFLEASTGHWEPAFNPIYNTFNGSPSALISFLKMVLPNFEEETSPILKERELSLKIARCGTQEYLDFLKETQAYYDDLFKAVAAQKKLTKAIATFFKNESMVETLGQKKCKRYSDVLVNLVSEMKQRCESGTKETEVTLSIHPYDFVTMSYNGLGWRSCFAPSGDYAKATLVVMADASTLVSFSSSPEVFCQDPVVLNNKKVRQMVHFNSTLDGILFNKVYPSSQAGYEGLTLKALLQTGIVKDLTKESFDFYDKISFSEAVYEDIYPVGEDDEFLGFFEEGHAEDYMWNIGVEGDICMECGGSVSDLDGEGSSYPWLCWDCDRDENGYSDDEWEKSC